MSLMNAPLFPQKYRMLVEVLKVMIQNGLEPFEKDASLLQTLWDEYKAGFHDILSKVEMGNILKLGEINFVFHLNENYQFSYDPTTNSLELNILSFFFHINPNDDRIFFEVDYKMAALIVHGIDHYYYSKEQGVIGWSEEERDDFDKEHLPILENRAYSRQMEFLKRYLKIADKQLVLFEITPEGKVGYLIEDSDEIIGQSISWLEEIIKFIEENEEKYLDKGKEQSKRIINRIGKLFGISIEKTEIPTKKIQLDF